MNKIIIYKIIFEEENMQVGLIGLGKMGLNLGQNLLDHNHEVVAL